MGALLSTPRQILNLLLPFTDPSTPLIQDLIHTLLLCGTLYFAPQLVELYNDRLNPSNEPPPQLETSDGTIPNANAAPEPETDDLPLEENLVLQPSDTEDLEPPPLAPTPPPGQPFAQPQQHPQAPQNPFQDQENNAPAANRPRATPQNRPIGAKKARSIALRDQRRAYHEFHQQEAFLRREQEAAGAAEREAALLAEKNRRAAVEKEIQERDRHERALRKEAQEVEREEERERRERVMQRVRVLLDKKGAVDLDEEAWKEEKDGVWAERLVRASGLLTQASKGGEQLLMITRERWLVKIDKELMQKAYADAVEEGNANNGKVSFEEFGWILESAVRARAKAWV